MTPLQHRCLEYVRLFIFDRGYSPSYGDIAKEFGCSRSQAFETIAALIGQGELVRTAAKKRNLRFPGVDLSKVPTEAMLAELERRAA
jgi:SOS-response transcriptional repressor LexA